MNFDFDASVLKAWLAEDLGGGDLTTDSLIPPAGGARAVVIAKQKGVVCGLESLPMFLRLLKAPSSTFWHLGSGNPVAAGDCVVRIQAPHAELLKVERTFLNLAQHLCGISSLTARFVEAVLGTRAKVVDTRKTIPGLRKLAKQAVLAGGGINHRIGLHDAILIKENHLGPWRGHSNPFSAAIARTREAHPDRHLTVEVRDLDECRMALEATPDVILLDNFTPPLLREAVAIRDNEGSSTELEASGGVNLDSIREIAHTGIERISIGALTHSAPALDLSMLIDPDIQA